MLKIRISLIAACLPMAILPLSCRLSQAPEAPPLPLSQKVSLEGYPAPVYSDSLPETPSDSNPEAPIHAHAFLFTGGDKDTLRLRLDEYRSAFWAYAAYQKSADPEAMAEGFYRNGHALIFRHDRFIGTLAPTRATSAPDRAGRLPPGFLKQNLSFRGEPLFDRPKEFEAFPLLGRIAHSERIMPRHFLGREWQGPVFTVRYHCHGDTAIAFRALAQDFQAAKAWIRDWQGQVDTLNWGREIHFQGWDEFRRPLVFWVSGDGVMGFAGCYDSLLAQEYAKKMEKTAVFWSKP